MATEGNLRHRPGNLKQQNKKHNAGKHRTKREIERVAKGRQSVQVISRRLKKNLGKDERRLKAKQSRHNKRQEILSKKRGLGGDNGPPILVTVLILNPKIRPAEILSQIEQSAGSDEGKCSKTESGLLHLVMPRFKKRLEFIFPEMTVMNVLDVTRVSDVCLLITDGSDFGEREGKILHAAFSQGLPTVVPTIRTDANAKTKNVLKTRYSDRFPDQKVYGFSTDNECLQVLRLLCNLKVRERSVTAMRPHMLAENVELDEGDIPGFGTLKVTGYLRSQNLTANSLVHVPGYGDFGIKMIESIPDPNCIREVREMRSIEVLQTCNYDKRPSLEAEAEVDPMAAEQTWPTQEELEEADKKIKTKKKVPKGTSGYQAAWIVESDEEIDDEDDDEDSEEDEEEDYEMEAGDEDEEESDEEGMENAEKDSESEEEMEEVAVEDNDKAYDEKIDQEEEDQFEKQWREAREDEMFPDEMDTPHNIPARERFQRYRGLKSFRTSTWHPKENLPADYARIFQLANSKSAKKRALSTLTESLQGAQPGAYIRIHIEKVPIEITKKRGTLTVFGILAHEQKMSVVNILLKRSSESGTDSIKNKTQLIFQLGFRRFWAEAIFSQHTNANKHKLERYFRPDRTLVATAYAPITFGPAPALAFRMRGNGDLQMVGCGSLLNTDPDRIVCKRIVLSGHPFRIHRKAAVVRYMFFNREDIDWFKPVELRTKHGRRGHIKEALGTHGHMKCVFDGQIKSMDTVLLTLYKRVFPKWKYDSRVEDEPIAELHNDAFENESKMALD